MPTEARGGNYFPEPPYLRETKTYHSQPLESTRHAGNLFGPISIRPIFVGDYSTTDALKKISLLPLAPLRPEARGICHICHMVNPALGCATSHVRRSSDLHALRHNDPQLLLHAAPSGERYRRNSTMRIQVADLGGMTRVTSHPPPTGAAAYFMLLLCV